MLDLLVWAFWFVLGAYSFFFFFIAKPYKEITYEQRLLFLFIFSAVFFGIELTTLEGIKNVALALYLSEAVVEAPILNVNYSLRVMWDIALIGSFATFCLTVTCAYLLGKKVNLKVKDKVK